VALGDATVVDVSKSEVMDSVPMEDTGTEDGMLKLGADEVSQQQTEDDVVSATEEGTEERVDEVSEDQGLKEEAASEEVTGTEEAHGMGELSAKKESVKEEVGADVVSVVQGAEEATSAKKVASADEVTGPDGVSVG